MQPINAKVARNNSTQWGQYRQKKTQEDFARNSKMDLESSGVTSDPAVNNAQ